jgi:hypothetical protein
LRQSPELCGASDTRYKGKGKGKGRQEQDLDLSTSSWTGPVMCFLLINLFHLHGIVSLAGNKNDGPSCASGPFHYARPVVLASRFFQLQFRGLLVKTYDFSTIWQVLYLDRKNNLNKSVTGSREQESRS